MPFCKKTMRRIRRNSKTHQDCQGIHGGDRDTIPAQPCRDAKMIDSLTRGKSRCLLLENPDTVEIYKLGDSTTCSSRTDKDDVYLPAITTKASSLNSLKGGLSLSCSYLYDKRRGSFSSVTSQRSRIIPINQSYLKGQKEAKKSNVTVTMLYLGQGHQHSSLGLTRDELKVLQQVNGGQNICVFKGLVTPGEQFQFVSQRHKGFPFSVTLYVDGIVTARFSSCCEYRYAPGFQQGRNSCLRLTWLAGGLPCYRCKSLRDEYSSCQQLNNGTKESLFLPLEQNPGSRTKPESTMGSCPSSPLFVPAKPEKKSARRTRKYIKERAGGSTDSEDPAAVKETSKKKQCRGQTNQKGNKFKGAENEREVRQEPKGTDISQRSAVAENCEDQTSFVSQEQRKTYSVRALQAELPSNKTSKVHDSLQDEEALTKHNRKKENDQQSKLKDFYEECVEMSLALEQSLSKHNWFKANMWDRCRLQKQLSSHPKVSDSDVEHSAESDTVPQHVKEEPVKEQDLQAQLDAMIRVLSTSDEVEQLVLRNTDLTDDLLQILAGALKSSPSEVTLLNLNLNLIGPYGAHILLDLLRAKPQVRSLHLFGNRLRDHGVLTLLNGIAELQKRTARVAVPVQKRTLHPSEQNKLLQLPAGWSSSKVFELLELDIGGNGLRSNGVKLLASYMRHNSYLQYLGLAQTSGPDLATWKELFDSLKGKSALTHIILDENNLGDPGVRLLADVLRENTNLRQVDLDRNGITDLGGNDIMGALLCRLNFPLRHLGLEENNISAGLMYRIQEEVKHK